MWSIGVRVALCVVDAFVALTAVGGGIMLAAGLESGRFPVEWLEGTPFSGYLVPGLILGVVVGGSALLAAVATFRSPHAGGLASILAGVVLMGQIVGELLLLAQPDQPSRTPVRVLEVFYVAVGLLMMALGLVVLMVGRAQKAGRHRRRSTGSVVG